VIPEVAPELIREVVPEVEAGRRPGEVHRQRRVVPARPRARALARDELRRAIASPGALRQAFLLREVLGPPVASRDASVDRPV
jgi:hypothetical protein